MPPRSAWHEIWSEFALPAFVQVGPICVAISWMSECVPGSVDVTDDYPTRLPIRNADIIASCQWRGGWTLDTIGNAREDLASFFAKCDDQRSAGLR